jgi:tripartite-type tricarboxylate transporter receptor subunit TctC
MCPNRFYARFLVISFFGLSLIGGGHGLTAEVWPQRAVNLIVPFGSGSGPDIAARIYAEQLAIRWKQPVVVDNRAGAEGLIGVTAFAAIRDDHTLLFSPAAPISVYPFTQEKITYDPNHDLVPISSAANTFGVIAATASANVRSVAELVRLARAHPGELNWASGGGAFSLLFAGFAKGANLDLVQVFYRQPNLASQDLVEGRIQILASTLTPLLPIAQVGKVHLLAVTNKVRAPIAPDIPTATEAGQPELEFDGLTGFFGWRDMPAALRDRIASDVRSVAAIPSVAGRLAKAGQIVHAATPEEFARAIDEQRTRIAAIVRLLGKVER